MTFVCISYKRNSDINWKTAFEEASTPSEFWRLPNQGLRKHKAKGIGPISGPNDVILTHNLAKAEYFNDFFVNISEDLTKQLDPLDTSSLYTFVTRITPTKDTVDFSWKLVKDKLMKAANLKKATGPDNVSPKDLSLFGDSAIDSLLLIFNKSLSDSSSLRSGNCHELIPSLIKAHQPTLTTTDLYPSSASQETTPFYWKN